MPTHNVHTVPSPERDEIAGLIEEKVKSWFPHNLDSAYLRKDFEEVARRARENAIEECVKTIKNMEYPYRFESVTAVQACAEAIQKLKSPTN